MASIYQGDSTSSFGNNFITIRLTGVPTGETVSKAKLKIGNLPVITFDNPTFPLVVNLTESQTAQLEQQTSCYLAVYDNENRKQTCRGVLRFIVNDSVVD